MSNLGISTLGALANVAALGNLDLTTVETKYPVLATGKYDFKIVTSTIEAGKKDPSKFMWVLGLELTSIDANDNSVPPKPVPAGYKLTHRIGLTPTEKRTPDMVMRDVAELLDSVYGETHRRATSLSTFPIESLINQPLTASVSVDAATDEYPEQSRIRRLIAKAE